MATQSQILAAKGREFVETASNAEIMELLGCNAGRASNVRKEVCLANGWTNKATRYTDKPVAEKNSSNSEKPILGISSAMKKALDRGAILKVFPNHPSIFIDAVPEGSRVNPEFSAFMGNLLKENEEGFIALFGECPVSDFQLIGIETPSMRAKRIAEAEALEARIKEALALVAANGYRVIRDGTALFAQFQSTETLRLAEMSTMACLERRQVFADECAVKARLDAKHTEMRAKLADERAKRNASANASMANQISATAEMIKDSADQKISDAMKLANDALAAKQAAEEALQAVLARLAALESAQQKPASRKRA